MLEFIRDVLWHTPVWVWALLLFLIALGSRALRPHTMPRSRVLVVPIVLSLVGVFGSGRHGVALLIWAIAYVIAFAVSVFAWRSSTRVTYDAATDRLSFPGSPATLALMLTVFAASYTLAVMFAVRPLSRESLMWQIVPAAAFGLLSGALLGRRWRLFRMNNPHSIGRASAGSGRSTQYR